MITGDHLLAMLSAACSALEDNEEAVNSLNVFPVPDGDTGTNMLLTMRSSAKEAGTVINPDASSVASAAAKGGLMGARGNSGVILSQVLRGISSSFEGRTQVDGSTLAAALSRASEMA